MLRVSVHHGAFRRPWGFESPCREGKNYNYNCPETILRTGPLFLAITDKSRRYFIILRSYTDWRECSRTCTVRRVSSANPNNMATFPFSRWSLCLTWVRFGSARKFAGKALRPLKNDRDSHRSAQAVVKQPGENAREMGTVSNLRSNRCHVVGLDQTHGAECGPDGLGDVGRR